MLPAAPRASLRPHALRGRCRTLSPNSATIRPHLHLAVFGDRDRNTLTNSTYRASPWECAGPLASELWQLGRDLAGQSSPKLRQSALQDNGQHLGRYGGDVVRCPDGPPMIVGRDQKVADPHLPTDTRIRAGRRGLGRQPCLHSSSPLPLVTAVERDISGEATLINSVPSVLLEAEQRMVPLAVHS